VRRGIYRSFISAHLCYYFGIPMSSIYKKVSQKLTFARISGDSRVIRNAFHIVVDALCDEINDDKKISAETFSSFVTDEDLLFKTDKEIMSQNGPDTTLTTTGLIDQLLEMIGVIDHEIISDELKDGILGIHNCILDGSYIDIETKKEKISGVLDKLRLAIE